MRIQTMWEGYAKHCLPPDAPEEQVRQVRQAFYAGFISMFEINKIIGARPLHKIQAFDLLNKLQREIKLFSEEQIANLQEKLKEN